VTIDAALAEVVEAAVGRALERRRPDRIALTVPEAAEALGCGADLVRRLVDAGELPTVPTGTRRVLIPVDALRRFANGEPTSARLRAV
jgi:excisionase family DNA binding protein